MTRLLLNEKQVDKHCFITDSEESNIPINADSDKEDFNNSWSADSTRSKVYLTDFYDQDSTSDLGSFFGDLENRVIDANLDEEFKEPSKTDHVHKDAIQEVLD